MISSWIHPHSWSSLAVLHWTEMIRNLRVPQNMIGHHPAIRQINIFLELNCDHFWVNLNDSSNEPISNPVALRVFMVAKHIYSISDLVRLFTVRCTGEVDIGQLASLLELNNE
jgi:hypothetical protein